MTDLCTYQLGETFHMYYVPVGSKIEQWSDRTLSHKLQRHSSVELVVICKQL